MYLSNNNVKDLFTGQRWMSEIGLYDDRNRFMSPDIGRFLQPDPIGFKGDASNLYRYCGNDWANRSDPMGLAPLPEPPSWLDEKFVEAAVQSRDISVNNTDNRGVGLERGKSIWYSLKTEQSLISNDSGVGKKIGGGRQRIDDFPDFNGDPNVAHAHYHTNSVKVDLKTDKPSKKGVVMDKTDREGTGDKTGNYFYVLNKDGVMERYRPSDDPYQNKMHADWSLDRRQKDGTWKQIASAPPAPKPPPQASNAEPPDIGGGDFVMFVGGSARGGLSGGGAP